MTSFQAELYRERSLRRKNTRVTTRLLDSNIDFEDFLFLTVFFCSRKSLSKFISRGI